MAAKEFLNLENAVKGHRGPLQRRRLPALSIGAAGQKHVLAGPTASSQLELAGQPTALRLA
jgi:hypothetical protein